MKEAVVSNNPIKQRRRRYLALDAILPGDTILSSARSTQSVLIRLATGSIRASHAAIAIHPLIWFESIGKGVDYKLIRPQLIWDGKRIRLGMPIPRGERYLVRRPKTPLFDIASAEDRHAKAKELIDVAARFAFLNYERPTEFLATIRLGLGKTAFARLAASALDSNKSVFYPGPFCSWLVAECYADIGSEISSRDPQKITPAALERSSKLSSVEACVTAVPLHTNARSSSYENELNGAIGLISHLFGTISFGALLAKAATQWNSQFNHAFREQLPGQTKDVFKGQENQQRRTFQEWQERYRAALYHAYSSISVHTDCLEDLNQCHAGCFGKRCATMACAADSCDSMGKRFMENYRQVYNVFPEPKIPDEWLRQM